MKIRLAVLALLFAAPLQAQTGGASDVMTRAVRAYQDLEFQVAANLLRRVLAAPLAKELDDSTRALALTYLGAAEHYRGNADSAIAAFRRLVELAPHHAPDTLIFPPEITRLYEQVRSSMTPIAVQLAPSPPPPPPAPAPPPPPVATAPVHDTAPAQPEPGVSVTSVTVTVAALITNVRTGSIAGIAGGFEGSVWLRRLGLHMRYAEGSNGLVEGALSLRVRATPWLSMQLGPHARRFDTPLGAERWVTWRLGARGAVAIPGSGVRGYAILWRALALDVNLPSGSGSAHGGEIGVRTDALLRPFWLAMAYGIDQAVVRDANRRETDKSLTLTVGVNRR